MTTTGRPTNYRELIVWRKAVALAVEIYAVSRSLPADERFGLIPQLRRAAVSVAANIAEGHARQGRRDFVHYLSMARGSVAEVETQLEIARETGLLTAERTAIADGLLDEVSRMLATIIRKLAAAS
jgi:four helix bundle protein